MPPDEKKLRSFGDLMDIERAGTPPSRPKPRKPKGVPVGPGQPDGQPTDQSANQEAGRLADQIISQTDSRSADERTDQPTRQSADQVDARPTAPPTDRMSDTSVGDSCDASTAVFPSRTPRTLRQPAPDRTVLVPVSFKGDPTKVKALKLWALQNDSRLQDLFDEALTDLMRKLGIPTE